MREIARQQRNVTRLLFSWFFQRRTAEASEQIFTKIRQTSQFRARTCLFGVRKQAFNI